MYNGKCTSVIITVEKLLQSNAIVCLELVAVLHCEEYFMISI